MKRGALIALGSALILSGVLTAIYVVKTDRENKSHRETLERIKEGETLLEQSNPKSIEKARELFSELSSKQGAEPFRFRVIYGLANSLEQSGDKLKALEYYKELNQYADVDKDQKEKLSYSLGNVLLKLNREEEGKIHLNLVLKSSKDHKIRSRALASIADFYLHKGISDKAQKNFLLAIEEDPNNNYARAQLTKLLKSKGKDWSAFSVLDDSIDDKLLIDNELDKSKKKGRVSSFQTAIQLYSKKQYWPAIRYFKRALNGTKVEAEKEKILWYLGESYNNVGKLNESISYMDKVLENPDTSLDQAAVFRKGTVNFRMGKYNDALNLFQETIDKYPKSFYSEKAEEYRKETHRILSDSSEGSDNKEPNKKSNKGSEEAPSNSEDESD